MQANGSRSYAGWREKKLWIIVTRKAAQVGIYGQVKVHVLQIYTNVASPY